MQKMSLSYYKEEAETFAPSIYEDVKDVLTCLHSVSMAHVKSEEIENPFVISSAYMLMLMNSSTIDDHLLKDYSDVCEREPHKHEFDPQPLIHISRAFCASAVRAADAKNDMKAWKLVGYAKYWLGKAENIVSVKKLGMMMPADLLKENGRVGGKVCNRKYEPLRELARMLAGEAKFHSRRQAAQKIKPKILEEAKRLNVRLSPIQVDATISSWLKTMVFTPNRKR